MLSPEPAMPNEIATSWTIPVSPATDRTVREHLAVRGQGPDDLARFVEDAVKWRVLDQTMAEARAAFADLAPDELDRLLTEAIDAARKDDAGPA